MKTLLIDGNNLFKIGFHGVREFYHNGKHIGGVFHFLNTIRKFLEDNNYDKVIVFWDGENNSSTRKKIYPQYKENRRNTMTDEKYQSYDDQKTRVRSYLEEIFVRQLEVPNNESDDLIAYYCLISENEDKTIFSADKDYLQLVNDKVRVYNPSHRKFFVKNDRVSLQEIEVPVENTKTLKILMGDKSDNISGIYGLGEKTLVKFFPEVQTEIVSVKYILEKSEELLKEFKDNNTLKNILTGKTKLGIFGEEYYQINEQIIDLSNPLITEDAKELVLAYYEESLDPEDRGYRNLIRMMTEDGFFKFLPKKDEAWVDFVRPFMKLTRKEKMYHKKNQTK